MASFAAAYQREQNDAWLNQIVGEIIDPSQRINCRDLGRDSDGDLVDDPDYVSADDDFENSEKQQNGRTRASSQSTSGSFVTAPGPSRLSSRSRPRRKSSKHSSKASRSQLGRQSEHSRRRLSDGGSQVPASPLSGTTEAASRSSRLYYDGTRADQASPEAMPPKSRAPAYKQVARPPKALYRSISSQVWEKPGLRRQDSRLSAISEFSGFASHPAIRPLEKRDVLGEAAGPSEEDETEYPGPLALALIIVGICLSVFIISLDRNIITTVGNDFENIRCSLC